MRSRCGPNENGAHRSRYKTLVWLCPKCDRLQEKELKLLPPIEVPEISRVLDGAGLTVLLVLLLIGVSAMALVLKVAVSLGSFATPLARAIHL